MSVALSIDIEGDGEGHIRVCAYCHEFLRKRLIETPTDTKKTRWDFGALGRGEGGLVVVRVETRQALVPGGESRVPRRLLLGFGAVLLVQGVTKHQSKECTSDRGKPMFRLYLREVFLGCSRRQLGNVRTGARERGRRRRADWTDDVPYQGSAAGNAMLKSVMNFNHFFISASESPNCHIRAAKKSPCGSGRMRFGVVRFTVRRRRSLDVP